LCSGELKNYLTVILQTVMYCYAFVSFLQHILLS
jgi:hypothetical protein